MQVYPRFFGPLLQSAMLSLCLMAGATAEEVAGNEPKAFSPALGERQLFLDDAGIAIIENLLRTMHTPVKRGAVLRPTPPDETSLQTRSAPVPPWRPHRRTAGRAARYG